MRKMTLHILISVLLASVACIMGILLLMHNINIISDRYEENIRVTLENQRLMSDIRGNIYQTESLVWQHIVNAEEDEYDRYETHINELMESLSGLFVELETNLADDEIGNLLHTVVKQHVGFQSNTTVVLDLSRNGSKQSAQYYVTLKLNPWFDTVNETLDQINLDMDGRLTEAARQMEESIYTARVVAILCLIVVVFIIVVCVTVVFSRGQKIVGQQAEEQKSHQQRVMELQYNTIVGMANLIEGRDGDTGEHVKRTGWFVDKIARKLTADSIYADQIDEVFLDNLRKAAPLHDIGKIKVPDAILQKPGKLTTEEFEIMKNHAAEGGAIIYETMGGIEEHDYIEMAHDMAQYHHEKWDGSGYPEGRSGEDIPLCARIMAVADVFDALISKRCYKESMPVDEAYRIIEDSAGSHFDPVIAAAFITLRDEVVTYLHEIRGEV